MMENRPFTDKGPKPSEPALQTALGSAYTCWQKLLALASAYSQEWTFTKSSGWILKVYDRKKALFYLIPSSGAFKISLAIRESEREAFLGDEGLGNLHAQLLSAKKFIEGFALQFTLAGLDELPPLELLIGKLIAMRS